MFDFDSPAFTAGTHRACAPEETWDRIVPLFPTAGITRVAEVTWLDTLGVPVWQAVRPASHRLTVSQGKGATDAAAKVSAAMESLEIWHAEAVPARVRAAAASDLDLGYDPHLLVKAPGSLYHDRAQIGWVAATEVRTGDHSWLPQQLVELDYRPRDHFKAPMFHATSTGLASGNTWDEATLHALLEVLEREALCAAAARIPHRVDLGTVTDPACVDLVDRMSSGGNEVAVYDMTVDPQIPCFSVKLRSSGIGIDFDGSGAHLESGVALSRALTEAAQARVTDISGAREDIDPAIYRVLGALLPPPRRHEPAAEELVPYRTGTAYGTSISAALARVADRAAAWLGAEPMVVRLQRGLDLPVVKVVVPGARRDESATHRRAESAAGAR
jgi:ribosomal protein S12 methylthiotransferase accessory factor